MKKLSKALVSYVVLMPFGSQKEGDIITLDTEVADALVTAGLVREATQEDVSGGGGEEEEAPADEVVLTNALNSFSTKIEGAISQAVAKASKTGPTITVTREQPIFKSFGEFAVTVKRAKMGHTDAKAKLAMHRKTSGNLNETTAADGGELVPTTYADFVFDKVREYSSLFDRVSKFPTATNNLKIPAVSETSRADGSRWGGVRSYYITEGSALTLSKPQFTNITLELNKLCVLAYATQELLDDNQYFLESWLNNIVPKEFAFKIDDGILNGAGGGNEPTGIIGHASTVVVTKEGSQTATTFNYQNVLKMHARMYAPSMNNAVWIINQDVLPNLFAMTFPTASGTVPAYMPANGTLNNAAYAPIGTLFGKPILVSEASPTLGTVGDVIFADLSQYYMIHKGLQSAVSAHLLFNTDEQAFRFVWRLDGRPAWAGALTPYKGTNTLSPFITLQTRS